MADINPAATTIPGSTRSFRISGACGAVGDTLTFLNPTGASPDFWNIRKRQGAGATGGADLTLVLSGANTIQFVVTASSSGQANIWGGDIDLGSIHASVR